jgi:hypothetical protein
LLIFSFDNYRLKIATKGEKAMRSILAGLIFGAALFLPLPASAQPSGPELGARQFVLGLNIDRYHRNIRPRTDREVSYGLMDVFMGYGINRHVSFSAEGIIVQWNSCACDQPRLIHTYILGLGITAGLIQMGNYRLAAVARYVERFDYDKSSYREDENLRGISIIGQVERSFIIKGNAGNFWLGPGYFSDQIIFYYPDWLRTDKQSSYHNLGFTAGADILLFHHLKPYLYAVYADYVQPRFGLGYLF